MHEAFLKCSKVTGRSIADLHDEAMDNYVNDVVPVLIDSDLSQTPFEFKSQTVQELFSSEEGESYLPGLIEQYAKDNKVTPERIVIGAIHHLLFGETHGDGGCDFFANPTGIAYRTENKEEEHINATVDRVERDTWGIPELGIGPGGSRIDPPEDEDD